MGGIKEEDRAPHFGRHEKIQDVEGLNPHFLSLAAYSNHLRSPEMPLGPPLGDSHVLSLGWGGGLASNLLKAPQMILNEEPGCSRIPGDVEIWEGMDF